MLLSNKSSLTLNCRDVYSICVANGDGLDERLYKATKAFFEEHTKDIYTVSKL